jgi:hypothetical protein
MQGYTSQLNDDKVGQDIKKLAVSRLGPMAPPLSSELSMDGKEGRAKGRIVRVGTRGAAIA